MGKLKLIKIDNTPIERDNIGAISYLSSVSFNDVEEVTLTDVLNDVNSKFYYIIYNYNEIRKRFIRELPVVPEILEGIKNGNVNVIVFFPHEAEWFETLNNLNEIVKRQNINPKQVYLISNNYSLIEYKERLKTDINVHTVKIVLFNGINDMKDYKPNIFLDKKHIFTCHNRQPRAHRKFLIAHLIKNKLIEHFDWSFLLGKNLSYYNQGTNIFSPDEINEIKDELNYLDSLECKLSEYEIDNTTLKENDRINWKKGYGDNSFKYSYINLTTETNFNQSDIHITEKSMKPFFFLQIPLFLASYGHVKMLREQFGFDMFDDLIDHSYDSIKDNKERFFAVIKQVENMVDKKELIHNFYVDNQHRLIENQNKVLNILEDKTDYNYFKNLI